MLDHFSDTALAELLKFLKELDSGMNKNISIDAAVQKILSEDKELLAKLAK